ncbi:hypothetical protein [Aquibaculum sediminis]|uniref:hypothetical protein n=1 Tax=Aquibaculum sediminis TaxID=3231907 RepID=UPI0034546255
MGPELQALEDEAVRLVCLLHAGLLEVFQDHLDEVGGLAAAVLLPPALCRLQLVVEAVVHVHCRHAVGREALHREGPGHAHARVVLVGLVVEVFVIGLGGDRFVDLQLPRDAQAPPRGVQFLGFRVVPGVDGLLGQGHRWIE